MTKRTESIKPSTERLLSMAHRPVFPLFNLKLESSTKQTPVIQRLKVSPVLYDFLVKVYGTNELTFYFDTMNGKIECWTPSMHVTFKAMHELGLMPSTKEWVQEAKGHLEDTVSHVKTPQKSKKR